MEQIKTIKYNLDIPKKKPHYKVIILIIASNDNESPYKEFKEYWKKYMNKFQDVRSFFLYSDPFIDSDVVIEEETIIHRHKESYEPGILYKTIAGMKLCEEIFTFDYILRTNLSSFIHIPRLLYFLQYKPANNYAAAKQSLYREGIGFLSGAGFILSRDVVQEILKEVFIKKCINDEIKFAPDDVAITMIIQNFIKLDKLYELPRYDCESAINPVVIDNDIFHIRNKTEWKYKHRLYDISNLEKQIQFFYKNILENNSL
jgi:hypothetical protein